MPSPSSTPTISLTADRGNSAAGEHAGVGGSTAGASASNAVEVVKLEDRQVSENGIVIINTLSESVHHKSHGAVGDRQFV